MVRRGKSKTKDKGQGLLEALSVLGKEKGIDTDVLFEAIELGLISAYRKSYGADKKAIITIDREAGSFHIYAIKTVVDELMDGEEKDVSKILLSDARKLNPNYQVGDELQEEVQLQEFGRIAAQTAKQVVLQRIREAERGIIYDEFMERESDIITGIVSRVENQNVFIDLGRIEAVLSALEQIPFEKYKHGDRIKAYIVEVKKTSKGPQILASRTHPGLIKRLFELQVPEIQEGIVEIKSVAREAGMRSKIAVYSNDENVDPVGACVGQKGTRVQAVVNELGTEKIDIVKWSANPANYIANSLSPAKVVSVAVNEAEKMSRVVVPDYQLSLAIGKEGQNARLAAKLTGWKIDIKSESQAAEEILDETMNEVEVTVDNSFTAEGE